jgi:hypothetical protein
MELMCCYYVEMKWCLRECGDYLELCECYYSCLFIFYMGLIINVCLSYLLSKSYVEKELESGKEMLQNSIMLIIKTTS